MRTKTEFLMVALVAFLVTPFAGAVELAKVNGKTITDKDLKVALSGLTEVQKETVLKDTDSKKQVLDSLIDQEIIAQVGEKEKLDQNDQYKDALAAFRKQFLVNQVLQKNLGTKLTDSSAKKYFESNKLRYNTDQVHAQHILVAKEDQAKELLKKAKEADVDFQDLAEKNSKDPSAKHNRGDLGFFGRDRMVPEFTEAAFAGKVGDVVGPVKTSFGYHIIKIIDKRPGKVLSYDEVEARVKNDLRQELIQGYVGKLRKEAKIQVEPKATDHM